MPREISYEIAAIFEVGVYDYDKAFVVMPLENAQTLMLAGDDVGIIELKTDDPDNVNEIIAPLLPKIESKALIVDWRQMNASLFETLAVERVAMFVVLSIIVLVAVFNILSSLIMLVRAKTRDIAILRTMGATRRISAAHLYDCRCADWHSGDSCRPYPRLHIPVFPAIGGHKRSSL